MVMGSAGGHAGATEIYKFQFLETAKFRQKLRPNFGLKNAWHTLPTRCSCSSTTTLLLHNTYNHLIVDLCVATFVVKLRFIFCCEEGEAAALAPACRGS